MNAAMKKMPKNEQKTITRADLAKSVQFELPDIDSSKAKAVVDAFFDAMKSALEKNEEIKLLGLGNFQVKHKNTRIARNPRTGTSVLISPRRVVTFHTNPKLKMAMANANLPESLDNYGL